MRERLWQLKERSFRRVLRLCLTGADAEHTQDTRKHMQWRELTCNGTGLMVICLHLCWMMVITRYSRSFARIRLQKS
jgi:hypothetical protein